MQVRRVLSEARAAMRGDFDRRFGSAIHDLESVSRMVSRREVSGGEDGGESWKVRDEGVVEADVAGFCAAVYAGRGMGLLLVHAFSAGVFAAEKRMAAHAA
jgi:hypothetical protein